MIEVSIIMPCLNEAETIGACITKARDWLERSGVKGEIVVGDNGSTDKSVGIAESLGARIVHVPQRGYGAALHEASLASNGRYCIMGDADDSYDFSDLDAFIERLRSGDELVMGNRFLGGIEPGAMPWKNRYIGNPILSTIGRLLFRVPARDFHCGIRGYSKAAFILMDLRTTGMEFASEMVIKATLLGLKISEVPTTLKRDGRSRPPHLRPFHDGWRHLRFMLLFSPNWLFFYPGIFLVVLGVAGTGTLLIHSIHVGGFRFGIDTLIYFSAMISSGLQAVFFSILSRAFAIQEGLYPHKKTFSLASAPENSESWLISGVLLFTFGIYLAIYALHTWEQASFGALQTERIARVVIISSLATVLGIETILSGFFLSTLRLGIRQYRSSCETGKMSTVEARIVESKARV